MHIKQIFLFLFIIIKICITHPNCIEPINGSYFPPQPDPPLQFCDEYNDDIDGSCCNIETEMTYAGNVVPTIIDDENSQCYDYIKKLYCTFCAPYAGHFYETEGTTEGRDYSWMCKGFCDRLWDACANVPLNTDGPSTVGQVLRIPGLTPNSGIVTLASLYANKDDYCNQFTTDNPVSCYSDDPEEKKVSLNGPGVPYKVKLAFPNLNLMTVPNDKGLPLHITHMTGFTDGSNRICLTFQHGVIVSFENNPDVQTYNIVLDLQDDVYYDGGGGSEYGVMAVEFHPLFAQNGWMFVKYSHLPNQNHLTRYTIPPGSQQADVGSKLIILSYETFGVMHHGGQPQFGNDGYLYYPTGDGVNYFENFYEYNPAIDPQSLLGKVLRIDVNNSTQANPYTIPADNPFIGVDNWRGEIYAYGLRNPWRFYYDPVKDRFWYGGVGQTAYEAIYVLERGKFHGWHKREGYNCYYPIQSLSGNGYVNCATPDEVLPLIEFPHALTPEYCEVESDPPHCQWQIQGNAVIGGWVYRGKKNPSLLGTYIFSNFEPSSAAKLYMVQHDENNPRNIRNIIRIDLISEGYADCRIPTLGRDAEGEIYVINYDLPNQIWTFEPDENNTPYQPQPQPNQPQPNEPQSNEPQSNEPESNEPNPAQPSPEIEPTPNPIQSPEISPNESPFQGVEVPSSASTISPTKSTYLIWCLVYLYSLIQYYVIL